MYTYILYIHLPYSSQLSVNCSSSQHSEVQTSHCYQISPCLTVMMFTHPAECCIMWSISCWHSTIMTLRVVTHTIIILGWVTGGLADHGSIPVVESHAHHHLLPGSSLHSWVLSNRLSSYTAGLQTIDDDLTFLYGQLPSRIKDAAFAVMDKAERGVQTDVFVAGINILGTAFT